MRYACVDRNVRLLIDSCDLTMRVFRLKIGLISRLTGFGTILLDLVVVDSQRLSSDLFPRPQRSSSFLARDSARRA